MGKTVTKSAVIACLEEVASGEGLICDVEGNRITVTKAGKQYHAGLSVQRNERPGAQALRFFGVTGAPGLRL